MEVVYHPIIFLWRVSKVASSRGFSQHVSHLILCPYMIDADVSLSYLLPEVMVFDVQVFCPWSHFGYLGYLDGPFIVLKDPAVDPVWLCIHCYSLCFNFLQEPHEGKNLSHRLE